MGYMGYVVLLFFLLFHFGRIIEIGLEKGKSGQAAFSFSFLLLPSLRNSSLFSRFMVEGVEGATFMK